MAQLHFVGGSAPSMDTMVDPNKEDGSSSSSSLASSSQQRQEEAPQAVSSDEEMDENDTIETTGVKRNAPLTTNQTPPTASCSSSRLFASYRTVGLINFDCQFDVLSHQSSDSSMLACGIGRRFQLVQLDKLRPVLVSQSTHSPIRHIISEASLQVTVCASLHTLHLFRRTQRVAQKRIKRPIVSVLKLGKVPWYNPTNQREENALLLAVTSCTPPQSDHDSVPVVGHDDEDDESIASSSSSSSSSDDDDERMAKNDKSDTTTTQVTLFVATRQTIQLYQKIPLAHDLNATCSSHPHTYVNKMLVGGGRHERPSLTLLNVKTAKIIHEFTCLSTDTNSTVTTIEQSPAVDVVGVGTTSGHVHLVHLKQDSLLFSLHHPYAIQSLSFRTDAAASHYDIAPLAVAGSSKVTVWNLNVDDSGSRSILTELELENVYNVHFMVHEPMLIVGGHNFIKVYLFDAPDHSARLLRQRTGHSGSPTCIRYLLDRQLDHPDGTDARACQILSASATDRSLRVFSTARAVLDKEYSQGQGLEKRAKQLGLSKTELLLPPVTEIVRSTVHQRDWGDLVTIHKNHSIAYVWSTKRGAQSGPVLRQTQWNVSAMKKQPPKETNATSVTLSACGNFALVGTKGGVIYKYNVQSGIPRGAFPKDAWSESQDPKKAKTVGNVTRTAKALNKKLKTQQRSSNLDKKHVDAEEAARRQKRIATKLRVASHTGHAVTGLAVDSVNKTLVSVGADAKLILWNLQTHAPHKKSPYKLPSAATKLSHIRDSDLAAIALEDFSVILFDCSALSIVRRFGSGRSRHAGPITDLGFSPDGRSLYTSSLDSSIRVWDVPTNTCVDWLEFKSPPMSFTVSPTGEFLATCHAGSLGISLWSDKSYYQMVHIDGSELLEPARMDDPVPIADTHEATRTAVSAASEGEKEANERTQDEEPLPVKPKEMGLVTLSGLSTAHWKKLFHLELVKQRNKPKEAPKKPPSAPFFLQWRGEEPNIEEKEPKGDKAVEEERETEWEAAWSDDENDAAMEDSPSRTKAMDTEQTQSEQVAAFNEKKKRKITRHRSALASLLVECENKHASLDEKQFQPVTDYVASLGPSAIDVALASLCSGQHDLDEGLPLLLLVCRWLLEACESHTNFEAVNAYMHRFLYLHSEIIAGIKDRYYISKEETKPPGEEIADEDEQTKHRELLEAIDQLKIVQHNATERLQAKMEHTLCLLRHFSRMV